MTAKRARLPPATLPLVPVQAMPTLSYSRAAPGSALRLQGEVLPPGQTYHPSLSLHPPTGVEPTPMLPQLNPYLYGYPMCVGGMAGSKDLALAAAPASAYSPLTSSLCLPSFEQHHQQVAQLAPPSVPSLFFSDPYTGLAASASQLPRPDAQAALYPTYLSLGTSIKAIGLPMSQQVSYQSTAASKDSTPSQARSRKRRRVEHDEYVAMGYRLPQLAPFHTGHASAATAPATYSTMDPLMSAAASTMLQFRDTNAQRFPHPLLDSSSASSLPTWMMAHSAAASPHHATKRSGPASSAATPFTHLRYQLDAQTLANAYPLTGFSSSRQSVYLTSSTATTTTAGEGRYIMPALPPPAPVAPAPTNIYSTGIFVPSIGVQQAPQAEYTAYQPAFGSFPSAAPLAQAPSIATQHARALSPCDDADGHFIVKPRCVLNGRYTIVKLLGQGTFGKVAKCIDRVTGKPCAVKIIRAVQKYRDASKVEIRVLRDLKARDPSNLNRCIHLRDLFDHRNHVCMVFDLLGMSIFDWMKLNGFHPFPPGQLQSLARQLLASVAFIHRLQLCHTDIKPENILLVNEECIFVPGVKANSVSQRVLARPEICLIDFGSATYESEYHSAVVSTRHYRAPEIILGCGWSYPCDMWSVGCILVELFTGEALFQTHDNIEHLAMMEAILGKISVKLIRRANEQGRLFFRNNKLDYPRVDTSASSRRYVSQLATLSQLLSPSSEYGRLLLDLVRSLLAFEPSERLSASAALNHPFFWLQLPSELPSPPYEQQSQQSVIATAGSLAASERHPGASTAALFGNVGMDVYSTPRNHGEGLLGGTPHTSENTQSHATLGSAAANHGSLSGRYALRGARFQGSYIL